MAQQTVTPQQTAEPPVSRGSGIADPAPLGLAGFAGTTFVLSVVNTGMVDATAGGVVLGLALFYGGVAQFLAGMWEFARGNLFGAVAFGSYGAFWLSFWWLENHPITDAPGNSAAHAVGVYLLMWAIFTAMMTVGATRINGAVTAVLVFLTLTYLILAIANFASSTGWTKFGGWVGLITAILAWYTVFAIVVNSTFKRVVLPVFPRS